MSNRRSGARVALALLGVVSAVYLPSLWNGFVYDDHEVVVVQPRPEGPEDLARLFAEPHFRGLPYYRPVVRASLLAQKALHGDRPGLFHLGNALLAGAAAAAAFALLRAPALRIDRTPAALAAALFAVHPVASSAVYPIASGRETLLPAVLVLCAVAAWLRARRGSAAIAFAAALLAKEQAVVTPMLFVLADLCGISGEAPALRREAAREWVRRYAMPAALLLGYFALRRAVLEPGSLALAVLSDPIAPLLSFVFGVQVALAPFAALRYEPEVAGWLSPARIGVAAVVARGDRRIRTRREGSPAARRAVLGRLVRRDAAPDCEPARAGGALRRAVCIPRAARVPRRDRVERLGARCRASTPCVARSSSSPQ